MYLPMWALIGIIVYIILAIPELTMSQEDRDERERQRHEDDRLINRHFPIDED
jgi:hypothetical protein